MVIAVIFFLIAALHVLRIFLGWEAIIGGWVVPMWLSWGALVASIFLVWSALRGIRV